MRKTTMIVLPNAASLHTIFYLEPVWNLRQGAVAAFRIRSVTFCEAEDGQLQPAGSEDLTPACQLELALRQVQFAEEVWETTKDAPPAFHLPVAFGGLSSASARTALVSSLLSAKAKSRRLVVLELVDVPAGAPAMMLKGLIAQLGPVARGILVQTSTPKHIERWRGAGLCGVVRPALASDQGGADQLMRYAAAAADAKMAAVACDASTRSQVMQAWAAGFSHLSGDVISSVVGEPVVPQRFEVRDLYAAPRCRLATAVS